MKLVLIIATTCLLPLVWGWGVCFALARLWPERPESHPATGKPPPHSDISVDYQI